jgi:hypothetical protein
MSRAESPNNRKITAVNPALPDALRHGSTNTPAGQTGLLQAKMKSPLSGTVEPIGINTRTPAQARSSQAINCRTSPPNM